MFNIAPYISKYVRAIHGNVENIKVPYSQTQFGVVLMIDVVGFSTLTTLATEKGDSGAEAIALEIGTYMGECIEIIEYYGGDVVKFLGDAVLVCFQPFQSDRRDSDESTLFGEGEDEISERKKNLLVRKALECGLQLLARLSHYRVYLTAEERSRHRAPYEEEWDSKEAIFDAMNPNREANDSSSSQNTDLNNENTSKKSSGDRSISREEGMASVDYWKSCFQNINSGKKKKNIKKDNKKRKQSDVSDKTTKHINQNSGIDLELHMALSCGNVTNIILGDLDPRESATHQHPASFPQLRTDNANTTNPSGPNVVMDEFFLEYHGRLEYAIGGPVVDALDEALSIAKAGEMSLTESAYEVIQRQSLALVFEPRRRFYVMNDIVDKVPLRKSHLPSRSSTGTHSRKGSGVGNCNSDYLRSLPGLYTHGTRLEVEPLIPRIRNTSFMNIPINSNSDFFKYINRSALYRLRHSIDDTLPAQFRDVTIMFVSLGKTDVTTREGLYNVQKAVLVAIQVLVKYEGMLQQFAIDDKGATLLVVFGLPPLSHEREAVFAAKAALEIKDFYSDLDYQDYAISLSTGMIFTAVLPHDSPYRRDPSIAGDTIVVAVRMLKFPFSKRNVVCDLATKNQIGGLCEFEDYGEHLMKGKVKTAPIYGIQKFGPSQRENRVSTLSVEKGNDFIGYRLEMKQATDIVEDWNKAPNHHVLVISGSSGVGKSFFCNNLQKKIASLGVLTCWSSSTEVEKGSKYYLLRNLMLGLFEIADSDRIPHKKSARSIKTNSVASNISQSLPKSVHSTETTASSNSPSSTSFPNNREWFRRLASYTSVPESVGRNSNQAITNEVIELISRCLYKCGEEEGYMPLFKVIFTTLSDVDENRYTRLLDGRARDILLTGVITRMVLYISKHVGLVFVCDDVQWADTASIRILQQIHEQCQRVMILMATRPMKDYNVTFVDDYRAIGSYEEIKLLGLGQAEIGEIILQNFDSGVNRINKEIVNVFQKRTGGNPLYVKNMAIVLKDFNHVTVVEGELVPSSNRFDLDDLLGNFDYKRIIKMQFDRLDSNFQEFLTVASCLDQYFTIYEVGSVIRANNYIFKDNSTDQIQTHIKNFDVYHFLEHADNGNPIESSVEVYTFSHITIPQCLYDMVSYQTRTGMHRALAKYYEKQLNRENYNELLGKITRHYLQTDAQGKQLYYLEKLAEQNMQNYLLAEATINLQKIVKILDENEDLLDQFGAIHLSDIYRKLGVCFTMRTKLKEGENFLYKALECLGEPWPKTKFEFQYKFWKNRFNQYQHRNWGVFGNYSTTAKREHGERVVEIMAQLSNIYFYTGNGRDFLYTCLLGLNACEKLGDVGPYYTLFLARYALLCWLNDAKENSILYIAKALHQMNTDRVDPGTLTICALLSFAAGKFTNARDLLYQSIEGSRTLGEVTDCQAFYRSVGLVVTMRIFEGAFDKSSTDMALLKQMADTAHRNGDFEAEIWLGVYNVGNAIVMDRMGDCSPYVALLEAHVREAADYNCIAIHGTLVCYYARIHTYDLARRHIQKLIDILPLLTVTPNIFPIFGLIFATMGLYCMVEDGQIDLVSSGDFRNYEKFILGLSRLNHAFQQVKFWEFTQPCLYLARALPYMTTRRIVEGYMVLKHGAFEMHFIQEIRFLKAYYWANLGKFAFTPEDRIDWTERAKADFEHLGIPADTYCNPDPESYYHRGLPADLCTNQTEATSGARPVDLEAGAADYSNINNG